MSLAPTSAAPVTTRTLRTAIVNSTDRAVGGTETYITAVLGSLAARGIDVAFWDEGATGHERPAIRGIDSVPRFSARESGLTAAVASLRQWQPDVVFVQSLERPETERALLAIAPCVFFAHAYWGACISGSKTVRLPVMHPCERRFGPACLVQFFPRRCGGLNPITMLRDYQRQTTRLQLLHDYRHVVTMSEHMRAEYLDHGFAPNRVHALPPINSHQDEGSATLARPVKNGDGSCQLAYLGRLDRLKGARLLIESLPLVQHQLRGPLTLRIAGDGPDAAECRAAAQRVMAECPDVVVEFLGWQTPAQCGAIIDASDAVVLPSLWPEPLGLVGIEALARGVPVAAFAVGGVPEWLTDGSNGALASAAPPTAEGLASAIVRTTSDTAIRERVWQQAAAVRARYSVDRHVDALLPVLSAAAQSRRQEF